MTEYKLKQTSGMFLILIHTIVLLEMVFFRFTDGFVQEEFSTMFGIILPMFSGYTAAILSFIIRSRNQLDDTSKPVTNTFSFLSFFFPTILGLIIVIAIWLKAHNNAFENFEDFKSFLMLIESAFAIYVGMFVYTLFQKADSNKE